MLHFDILNSADMPIAVIAVTYSLLIFLVCFLADRYPKFEQQRSAWIERLRQRTGLAKICLIYALFVFGQHLVV